MTASTTVVLDDCIVLATASTLFDDGFTLAMGTLHRHIGCDIAILAIIF